MGKCIEATKALIAYQVEKNTTCHIGESFSGTGIHQTYYETNENINAALGIISTDSKMKIDTTGPALSVQGSGAHPFNLAFLGFRNIDTFDTNILAEPFGTGFRRAMMLKYDYYTFCAVMTTICSDDTSIEYINDTVMGLLPYMESDEAFYWKSVIDFNYKLQKFKIKRLNLFKMICMCEETSIESMTVNNNYLQGEKEYESLRKVLGQVNFNFKCSNAINLSRDFSDKKYVFLILSNILDYLYECWQKGWTYEQLLDYIKDLEKIMAPQGLMLIHYILNYIRSSTGAVKTPIIRGTNISVKDIRWGEIQQISPHPILGRIDGILFARCKSK